MLPGVNRRFEHARMLERRSGNDHRIDVRRRQQLVKVFVNGRAFLNADELRGFLDAVVEQVAERRNARARIVVHDLGVVAAASARAHQAHADLRIRL